MPAGFRQRRAIAERVARIKRRAVADRRVHVPAKIRCRAIEPVVDHLGDFGAACKGAIKYVVVDAVLGEQFGEFGTVALFDGVAECAEHG
jgi:hypothetical protein